MAKVFPDIVEKLSIKSDEFTKSTVEPLNPPSLEPDPDSNPSWGDKWSPGWC